MKKVYLQFSLLFALAILLTGSSVSAYTIHSTAAGGPWDSTWTWVEGIVPSVMHDVVINGTVYSSNDNCHNLTINSGGILRNMNWYYSLIVTGDVVNNGTITVGDHGFDLYVAGDITNNGVWNNNYTHFTGGNSHLLRCQNGHAFSGYLFNNTDTGNIVIDNKVYFDNVHVEMNNTSMSIPSGGELKIHHGYLYQCSLVGLGSNATVKGEGVYGTDAPYFQEVNFTDLIFTGCINIAGGCNTYGLVTNNGDIQNNSWYYDLTVNGDLINNGNIQNYAYSFTLKLYGDFTNNGTCSIHALDFYGTTDQTISELNGQTFTPGYVTSYKPSGKIVASTDIDFANCILNFQEDTLLLPNNGKIKVIDGQLNNAVIVAGDAKGGNVKLEMNADAYMQNCELYNPEILGRVRVYGNDNVFHGNTVVTDTLDNYGWYYSADFYDQLTNNGVIENSSYQLTAKLYGDFTNNGTCSIHALDFYGTTDQTISELNGQTFTPGYVTSYKPSGKIVASTDIDFANCILNFQEDTLLLPNNGKIKVIDGQLNNAVIVAGDAKGGNVKLEMNADAYMQNCELYNPEILGRVRVYGNDNVFHGNTVVTDTLDNYGWYYHINIPDNIFNQGVIQDASYSLYLHIGGDITNKGLWENDCTYLEGTGDQHVTCLAGNRFSGYQLESNNTANVYFDALNAFDNVRIDFHDNSLHLGDTDTLIIHNAYLYRCNVVGDTSSVLRGEGVYGVDAPYFDAVVFNDLTLEGIIACYGNGCSTNGLITNNGVLMNTGWYYTLNIHGDIINNQTVRNSGYAFTVNIDGDIINNGSWINSTTSLTGSSDQTITIQNGHIIQCHLNFVSDLTTSPYQWMWDANPVSTNSPFFSGATSANLQLNGSLNNYYTGTYYCSTGAGNSRNIIVNDTSHRAMIYAVLEGAYNGVDMDTDLNSGGLLPLSQPFNTSPWNYDGAENVSGLPNGDIVDWVLVEFYDAVDAASASVGTPFARRACFLKKNGEIVDIDGGSRISFSGNISNNLFIKVIHRNHVAVLSANPASFSAYYYYSFNTATGQAYGNNQKWLGSNAVMIGGDANADGSVNQSDLQLWRSQTGSYGYLSADFGMNGEIDNSDKNEIFVENMETPSACSGTFTDSRDGKSYAMVQIGAQCWMAENLNYGTMITGENDMTNNGIAEKYCYDDTPSNCSTYGGLYQWNEAMQYSTTPGVQGLCPAGWHLPTDTEWCELEQTVDASISCGSTGFRGTDGGSKLKSGGSSGFNALLAGNRSIWQNYLDIDFFTNFWTSNQDGSNAWNRELNQLENGIGRNSFEKEWGYSIRCIKD